ncbi:hypothetical protein SLEP1_g23974 [Rubroshorea leprosula]|uniref:Uncharacterized protein n=1 Tax=Rubroshorea leprosula TaxID=152421 RepID=A0AAV5JMU3_9ROSI|nr:hypothetical protein SLEP1_g23974 [Rubroshorea leprosula]
MKIWGSGGGIQMIGERRDFLRYFAKGRGKESFKYKKDNFSFEISSVYLISYFQFLHIDDKFMFIILNR